MKSMRKCFVFVAFGMLSLGLGLSAVTLAATPDGSKESMMLIEPEGLQKRLGEPGLRILDSRPRPDYQKSHIDSAVWVDVKAWQQLGGRDGGFHDPKAWSEQVGRLGIGKDTPVVIYGTSLPDAARVWWTLKYLGLPNVALLDGGWELWRKQERPTDTALPRVEPIPFEPKFQADRLEEMDALKKSVHAGKVTVVDARSPREFTGAEVRGKRGGHIAGARHLEWKELLAGDGRFKSPNQLHDLFRKRGIDPNQTAVTC
jgi:thiosulfate/3-mercaptopyruvate sulfurtransferase